MPTDTEAQKKAYPYDLEDEIPESLRRPSLEDQMIDADEESASTLDRFLGSASKWASEGTMELKGAIEDAKKAAIKALEDRLDPEAARSAYLSTRTMGPMDIATSAGLGRSPSEAVTLLAKALRKPVGLSDLQAPDETIQALAKDRDALRSMSEQGLLASDLMSAVRSKLPANMEAPAKPEMHPLANIGEVVRKIQAVGGGEALSSTGISEDLKRILRASPKDAVKLADDGVISEEALAELGVPRQTFKEGAITLKYEDALRAQRGINGPVSLDSLKTYIKMHPDLGKLRPLLVELEDDGVIAPGAVEAALGSA